MDWSLCPGRYISLFVSSDSLKAIRQKLDALDKSIVDALATRDQLVEEVAQLKTDPSQPVRDVSREEALLGKVVGHAESAGVNKDLVTRLFREIMDHSLRRQHRRLTPGEKAASKRTAVVAYQGTQGSYSNQTAARHFSSADFEVELRGFPNFKQAIDAVANGEADYGVLPVENTTAGSINETYDLLAKYDLHQIGEEVHRIEHCLLAVEPVPLGRIRRILSQAQALAQCTDFLDSLDNCQAVSFTDTAMACQKIQADQDLSEAAIASEEAGRLYGLHVIKRNVANQKDNFTRFAVVAREAAAYDLRIPCKTSIILATRHEKGALLECLKVLAQSGLNLSKLESRPRPNVPWQYLFYIDFEGNIQAPEVQEALLAVKAHASYMKILGSYPARTTKASAPAQVQVEGGEAQQAARVTKSGQEPISVDILKSLEQVSYRLASRANRQEDTIINIGRLSIGGPSPVLLAGPGVITTQDELRSVAELIKNAGGGVLVGACYTQTRERKGLGDAGLEMLSSVGREFDLPKMTEVVHPDQVVKSAAQVDLLQISARNMQNFELLKAVGQVDCPVMLRRGLMASLEEWLVAAEFVLAQGNQQVILCERGIKTFETATRSTLDLSCIPILRERTHLPVVVDPSDACGQARWILPLAEAALVAGADGVMVEVGASGSEQSLSEEQFTRLSRRMNL